jgi:hypothetical protein
LPIASSHLAPSWDSCPLAGQTGTCSLRRCDDLHVEVERITSAARRSGMGNRIGHGRSVSKQRAQILRAPSKGDVLKGLMPKRPIGYGESQSAMRMISHVNGVQPIAKQ